MQHCQNCTVGHFCPVGSSHPTPCEPGTFSDQPNNMMIAQCTPCPAGRACPSSGLVLPSHECALGHYCNSGTQWPTQHKCPAGTWNPNSTSFIQAADCLRCPERFACLMGSGHSSQPLLKCARGHFCPPGTRYPTEYPCPRGTYTQSDALQEEAQCTVCPGGFYCIEGSAEVSGRCTRGYYCPPGTGSGIDFPCPAGTFSNATDLKAADECRPCPVAHFCPPGSVEPVACYAGTYSSNMSVEDAGLMNLGGNTVLSGNLSAFPSCITCPPGFFCPHRAMLAPLRCGKGFYSKPGQANCTICPVHSRPHGPSS